VNSDAAGNRVCSRRIWRQLVMFECSDDVVGYQCVSLAPASHQETGNSLSKGDYESGSYELFPVLERRQRFLRILELFNNVTLL
jgi:hypothetical protein